MRIGIDGLSVTPQEGGFYRAFKQLIGCCETLGDNHSVIVFLSRETFDALPSKPSNVVFKTMVVPYRLRYYISQLYFPFAERRHKLDVIYSPVSASPVLARAKKVCLVHDLSFVRTPNELSSGARLYWHHVYLLALKKCRKIACVSEATKRDIVNFLCIVSSSITVIYHYLDERFCSSRADKAGGILDKYKVQKPYLLYVGILSPRKNINTLLEAFSVLTTSEPDMMLVLCGKKGWKIASIEKCIGKLNLQNRVVLTGFVPDDDLVVLYENASLVVLPSFWEGFGYPLIEAMSQGVVAIGSNRGSIPEIIDDKRFLFDPEDVSEMAECIKKALAVKERQPALDELLRKRASGFSKRNTCKKISELLTHWE
ncbi:MAG: glycosyltransferase family 1 protein [Bacillota bacterium]